MKTVGIIGGIAPESTVVYYKEIVAFFLQKFNGKDYPQIIINSINMKKMLDYLYVKDLEGLTEFLLLEIKKLSNAGADFAVLASNTPHIVFDRLIVSSPLPMLSIVELTCRKAKTLGLKRPGLMGTKFTMQNNFYKDVFADENIQIITPDENSQNYINNIYFNELVAGIFLNDTRQNLLRIADKMMANEQIDSLILGGTELPLILKGDDKNIPFLDTTKIHVEGIMEYLINDNKSN